MFVQFNNVFSGRGVREGFFDLAFMPARATFYNIFFTNCGRGESLRTTTCPKTVVWVSKGMLHVKYFHSKKAYICDSWIS